MAGLVAITPAAGYVSPSAAVLIGFGVGVVCYGAVAAATALRVDDALDVFARPRRGRHVRGGGHRRVRVRGGQRGGRDGLLAGVPGQVAIQLVGVGVVAIYSAAMTAAILLAVNAIVRIRVPRDAEEAGLDLAQHGEIAYGA